MEAAPNQTIYVRNVADKLKKDEAKKLLYALFGQFGKVIDVVVMKTEQLRGQAWVVFADITAATNALRAMQGFPFFDKQLAVAYARTKSDAVARLEGEGKRQKKRPAGKVALVEPGAPPKAAAPVVAAAGARVEAGAPNRVLFVENLPEATTDTMLALLFEQFPGYREARLVPGRPGIGFVDFENEAQASVALAGLQNFKITPQHAMQVTFAKQS